nr:hypothetical protein GCM10017583_16910 [Agromyces mediolanus]
MVGAPVATRIDAAMSVLPTANDSAPCTKVSTSSAAGLAASSAKAHQPASSATPPNRSMPRACRSPKRPADHTPRNAPSPNSASTSGTADSSSPARSVTSGARKVNAQNVAPFTSAPSVSGRSSGGRRSSASSVRSGGAAGACSRGAGEASVRLGTASATPRSAGSDRIATPQSAARQSSSAPTAAPAGTPTMRASVVPPRITASARASRCGGTSADTVDRVTARKPALQSAATTRVASSTPKLPVRAPTTCMAMKPMSSADSAIRGDQRRASAAMSGAPTTMPTAKAVVSSAASGTVTSSSVAIAGRRPASMNSEVPCAKTATASSTMRIGMSELR